MLGKIQSLLRSEGVFPGGKRILAGALRLVRPIGSGDILFVASGIGDSARYRCDHVAEMLRLRGFAVVVTSQDSPGLSRCAKRFSVIVFHRSSWTPGVRSLFESAVSLKKTILFDTDDLVFDAELFKKTAAYEAMNALEKKQYEGGVGREFLESPFVSALTTTTPFLAERLRVFGKPVFIVGNRLSGEDARIAESLLRSTGADNPHSFREDENRERRSVVIGYFSGSSGHDRDFETVSPILADLLSRFPELSLFLAGPLSVPDSLAPYADRIARSLFVPRAKHFENLSRVDINIAPLEIGDPFCESKSELKFFEAGIVRVPTVAAATRTFRDAITDGVDGFVAQSSREWLEKLERLIRDSAFRNRMGDRVRQTALRVYGPDAAGADKYVDFLKERV